MRTRTTWWTIVSDDLAASIQPPHGPWSNKAAANEALYWHYTKRLDRIETTVAKARIIGPYRTDKDARLAWKVRQ